MIAVRLKLKIARRAAAVLGGALLLWRPGTARAGVLVLLSKESPMYREAATAIETSEAAASGKVDTQVLSAEGAEGSVALMRRSKPQAVVAVGSKAAAAAAKEFTDVPLVYLMIVYPDRVGLVGRANTYGVSWLPSARTLAQTMRVLLPEAKRVGIVSSMSDLLRASLQSDFKRVGLEAVVSAIKGDSEVPSALRGLHGKIDLLWMGPDPVLSNESAYEIFKTFALQEKLPFLVPFALPDNSRAFAGITVTPKTAGEAADRLLRLLLDGRAPSEHLLFPDDVSLTVDLATAKTVGATIPDAALKMAAKVYR